MFLLRVPSLAMLCFFFLDDHSPFTLADSSVPTSYSPFDTTACRCDYSENTLAYPNHVSPPYIHTSSTPKLLKLVLAFGLKNTIATGVIILITLLNVVVHKLRQLQDGDENIDSSSSLEKQCRCFSIVEIQSATHNFDDEFVIGKGGFGKVYKGILYHGAGSSTVAVKRLNSNSKQGAREFWTEIEMLSKFRHSHLVSLIGYCNDFPEMILVYEYMPHGTLADHLFKFRRTNGNVISQTLSWEQRLKICIGAARGLDYLHTGTGVKHRVIHRDVKSSNILLDENLAAKISDFGLSKIGPANQSCSDVSTKVKGTFGYLDPEYFVTRRLTRKSDVYSFGVVLLEVLCGRPALDPRLEADQQALVLCVQRSINEGTLEQIIDPSLRDQISPDCLKKFVEVADKCLHNQANKRPTMADVISKLEFSLSSQQSTDSFILQEFVGSGEDTDKQEDSRSPIKNEELEIIPVSDANGADVESDVSVPFRGKRNSKMLQAIVSSWGFLWAPRHKVQPTRTKRLLLHAAFLAEVQCLEFSAAKIRAATNYFHEDLEITNASSGDKVFKGHIDQKAVAIKRLKSSAGIESFCEEVVMLSKTKHYNVVSFVGYCSHKNESCLVYDYMSNGSLYDRLYSNNSNDHLPWKRRIKICIGAVQGLNYLHTGMGRQQIVHRNIKPTTILLDENWVPKISGFDFAKLIPRINDYSNPHNTNDDCCAYEYIDSEYFRGVQCSEKSDVYSVGMVLLEVLCAREPIQYSPPRDFITDYEHLNLSFWLQSIIRKETLDQNIDPHLRGEIAPECLIEFVDIALNCLLVPRTKRPPMSQVLERLELAVQLQERAEAAYHHIDGNHPAGDVFFKLENIYPELSHRLDKMLNGTSLGMIHQIHPVMS